MAGPDGDPREGLSGRHLDALTRAITEPGDGRFSTQGLDRPRRGPVLSWEFERANGEPAERRERPDGRGEERRVRSREAEADPELDLETYEEELPEEEERAEGEEAERGEEEREEERAEPEGEEEREQLITVRINGKDLQVPISEAVAGYQRGRDYQEKTTRLANERREFEGQQQVFLRGLEQFGSQAKQVYDEIQLRFPLKNDYEEIQKLRGVDDAEYRLRMVEWGQRQQALEGLRRHAAEVEAARLQAQIPQEQEKLLGYFPQMKDPRMRAEIGAVTREYVVTELGFTPAEWDSVVDHRVVRAAITAALLTKAARERRGLIDKRVRNVPRVFRPGTSRDSGLTGQEVEEREVGGAKARLERTGSVAAAVALMGARQRARARARQR